MSLVTGYDPSTDVIPEIEALIEKTKFCMLKGDYRKKWKQMILDIFDDWYPEEYPEQLELLCQYTDNNCPCHSHKRRVELSDRFHAMVNEPPRQRLPRRSRRLMNKQRKVWAGLLPCTYEKED